MIHKRPRSPRKRRTCYDKVRMRVHVARRANPAASASLQLLAILATIFAVLPIPIITKSTPYLAPPMSPGQKRRNEFARRLGVPARYVDVVLACGRVPYAVLFEDIRKGGSTRADAMRELRKQVPIATIQWFDNVEKCGLWSDLLRCFDKAGTDEISDIRFLKATLAWLGGPDDDDPDPANGHGVTRVIID